MASFLLLSDRGLVYPYQRKSEGRDDRIFLSPWPNLEGEAPAEPPDRLGRSLALQARNEITTDGLYAYGAKSELCDGGALCDAFVLQSTIRTFCPSFS